MLQLKVSLDSKIRNKIEFCNISIQLVQVVIEQGLAMSPRNVTFFRIFTWAEVIRFLCPQLRLLLTSKVGGE